MWKIYVKRLVIEMTMDMFTIGGLLQEIRLERNKTQADMAEELEVSLAHYAKGTNRMSLDLLFKIMTVLDVDANAILLYGKNGIHRVENVVARMSDLEEADQELIIDNLDHMVDSVSRIRQGRKVR